MRLRTGQSVVIQPANAMGVVVLVDEEICAYQVEYYDTASTRTINWFVDDELRVLTREERRDVCLVLDHVTAAERVLDLEDVAQEVAEKLEILAEVAEVPSLVRDAISVLAARLIEAAD